MVGSWSGHGRVPVENTALLPGQWTEAGAMGNGSPIKLTQFCLYFEEIEFVCILEGGMNTAVSIYVLNLQGCSHNSLFLTAENQSHSSTASEVLEIYYVPPHPNTSSRSVNGILGAHSLQLQG